MNFSSSESPFWAKKKKSKLEKKSEEKIQKWKDEHNRGINDSEYSRNVIENLK